MELTSWMKMARYQTFWIHMRKNKPLDENRKSGQTSRTKMTFTLLRIKKYSEKIISKTKSPSGSSHKAMHQHSTRFCSVINKIKTVIEEFCDIYFFSIGY
ncbi:hypothetical protein Hanom_Chr12g01076731 [Helianthus anomalus]